MSSSDLRGICTIIHGTHIDHPAILVQYEKLGSVDGSVAVGHLLGFINQVQKRKVFLTSSLGHFFQCFGGLAIGIHGDDDDAT